MPLGEEKQNAEAHIIGSHPDGKAVCDHRRRVGGSLRQDGPRCAENDPITRTTERDPEECGAACTCVRRCGSNYWRPEPPRRQVRTGLTPQGPAARDALQLCPSRSVSTSHQQKIDRLTLVRQLEGPSDIADIFLLVVDPELLVDCCEQV